MLMHSSRGWSTSALGSKPSDSVGKHQGRAAFAGADNVPARRDGIASFVRDHAATIAIQPDGSRLAFAANAADWARSRGDLARAAPVHALPTNRAPGIRKRVGGVSIYALSIDSAHLSPPQTPPHVAGQLIREVRQGLINE